MAIFHCYVSSPKGNIGDLGMVYPHTDAAKRPGRADLAAKISYQEVDQINLHKFARTGMYYIYMYMEV